MICLNCGRKLRNAVSREARYVPVCYRKMFGTSLQSSRKDRVSEAADTAYHDIPGQMTMEEYLQMDSE